MGGKRLFLGRKGLDLYNNAWVLFNAQTITAKSLYNLKPQNLDKKLKFNKGVIVDNISFISLVKFEQQSISRKVENTFLQDGVHNHSSPPINIHLNPDEEARFDEIVLNHPNVGLSGLQLGIPTLTGPGKSVKDLSHALHNCGCVIYQRSETRKKFTPHDPTICFSLLNNLLKNTLILSKHYVLV